MARIRKVEIKNFRGIKALEWYPVPGVNCLIGPGDSGKSSILDAIDLCLVPRRSAQFTDADFHLLKVDTPITITVTLGELDDALKSIEYYGNFLRGFDSDAKKIEDEPENGKESVLSLRLTVTSDLEPNWMLVSDRAETQGLEKNLKWKDRARLAPTRLGTLASHHFGWRQDSVLNRISEEKVDVSAALAKATREARGVFANEWSQSELNDALSIVASTAKTLGVPVGESIKAMIDAHAVSLRADAISLHSDTNIPLRSLGTGSARLLIAGLQREVASQSTTILIDELEHGLEPHRIIRLLHSLGAKESVPPLQVFMTTHSPVVLRELSGEQLFVVHKNYGCHHNVLNVGTENGVQGTIRLHPDAFLAPSVIICEGASEVGLIRGIDQYNVDNHEESITAQGTALVDCGGGGSDQLIKRANVFLSLGYRVAVLRDSDIQPSSAEANFIYEGGKVFAWSTGQALEDALFLNLPTEGIKGLVCKAIEFCGEDLINENIKSTTNNAESLISIQSVLEGNNISQENRQVLGGAAKAKNKGWFKSVTRMEIVARDVVGPHLRSLQGADSEFYCLIKNIFEWSKNGRE